MARGEGVDRAGVAAVLVERERHEAEALDRVVAVERLGRVVEHVEDVVGRLVEEELERVEPARREVLTLVDDDRVEARAELVDRGVERARQCVVEPRLVDGVGLRWQRPRLPSEVLA